MDISSNFLKGRMNKSFDERILPEGEYIDALNIRIGSTENNSVGAIENSLGNSKVTSILYNGAPLSVDARCIGSIEDGKNETIYWFVCDPGVVDMVLSYNSNTGTMNYHIISTSVLNFDLNYLITGVDIIDDFLFWTDNKNPPRKINVKRSYPYPVAGVDSIIADDILVIKAPPLESPVVEPLTISGDQNYMTDKFISFSYRYKYKDGEYSALSQFSNIAFEPSNFYIDYSSYTNGAMNNVFNKYKVSFNTGSSNVIGIDLCFKLSDSSIVNIIERYDKEANAWGDDLIKNITFDNKKIYTVLPSSELTRLFDNVPLTAKSQTTMGNRLIYGNYVDGYDIDTTMDYTLEAISEDVGNKTIPITVDSGVTYNLDAVDPQTISGSNIILDFTDVDLKSGSLLSINFSFYHYSFSGDTSYPTGAPENSFDFDFNFNITEDYANAYALSNSDAFITAIFNGGAFGTCSSGITLTDRFNCQLQTKEVTPPNWDFVGTGLGTVGEGFRIFSDPSAPNIIQLQIPAVKYVGTQEGSPNIYAYEYLSDTGTTAAISSLYGKKSLHSNRDFEVGITYQDDYLRSSTTLVCDDNTVFFPASTSDKKNYIKAKIFNKAPSWAKRYRFVVKPSKSKYETIYTQLFFQDDAGFTWFKLEGDNISKVKTGDTIVVKRDSTGALENLVTTTVLDVQAQSENFISGNKNNSGIEIKEPAGIYMKIRVSNFEIQYNQNSFIDIRANDKTGASYSTNRFDLTYPNPDYDPLLPVSPTNQVRLPYAIPAGTIVNIYLTMSRKAAGLSPSCGSRYYRYRADEVPMQVIANQDYENFYLFCIGEGLNFEDGVVSGGDSTMNQNEYIQTLLNYDPVYNGSFLPTWYFDPNIKDGYNRFGFFKEHVDYDPLNEETGGLYFIIQTGSQACGGHQSYAGGYITIQQATSTIVFETEALDADGEIYFEGSDSFPIVNGLHMSGDYLGDQDQVNTTTTPAIVTLNFFDCFSFGNGVESYKINDSLTGDPFYLGERVTAVAQEQYKQSNRYATLTYSGIYNAETNINKLNEFNLSLANFKDLEKSFGPINKLYARRTDILTLQEDKISYVLAGKNLLSDSTGGGQIASIPEVLGTQIARTEDYGISNNPESFAVLGGEVYFTDTKRNAVLNLRGGSAQGDTLNVISDMGMKQWFRDQFKDSVNYFKIGGYDPYMDEYVISLTEYSMPVEEEVYTCGVTISKDNTSGTYVFKVELGEDLGCVNLDVDVTDGESQFIVDYNGTEVYNDVITGEETITFLKSTVLNSYITVTIISDNATLSVTPRCVEPAEFITVVKVVLNTANNQGNTIHNKYGWSYGDFSSPYDTNFITLEADGVSLFETNFGGLSQGMIPANGSDITLISEAKTTDTFVFDPELNSFKYLLSNTLYDVPTLIPLLNTITPITGTYQATIGELALSGYDYLYLVWDYRESYQIDLCYNEDNIYALCCNCSSTVTSYIDGASFATATSVYSDASLLTKAADGYYMADSVYRLQSGGVLLAPVSCPGCEGQTFCFDGVWDSGSHPEGGSITYADMTGNIVTLNPIFVGDSVKFVAIQIITYTGVVESVCPTLYDWLLVESVIECAETPSVPCLIAQTGFVVSGDIVYNVDGITPFDGGGLTYNVAQSDMSHKSNVTISSIGEIAWLSNCI